MTSLWIPVFVLPNVSLATAIGCDVAVIAPAHDRRVSILKRQHAMFRRFLNRFADNFGAKFQPSVMLIKSGAPTTFSEIGTLASFRDIIALAAVTRGRALEVLYPRGHRVLFGDTFAIYPWMLDRNYGRLIGSSPAILGLHEVGSFNGQSSPSIFRTELSASDIDQPLLTELMDRWP